MAARNALTLGTSLAVTGGIALLVRLLIPRFLGPSEFGELRLAESFAEMLFVVLTLGVDTQLRLDAAVDPSKARSYLYGVAAFRLALSAAGILAALALLQALGSSDRVIVLFVLLGVSQTFLALNSTYAALEHASGDVAWLARTNFGMKALWATVMIAVLFQAASGLAIAITALSVEVLRFAFFTIRGIRWYRLELRLNPAIAIGALMISFPIFLNAVTHNLYARIGIGWLAATQGDAEVGLYGAAFNVASVALVGTPLLSWVLMPSTARAAAHSSEEANQLVSGALRIALLVGVPLGVLFHVGAAVCLETLFGTAYLPAAPVLQVMAPTVALTYMSTVCAIALIQRGHTWRVAAVSLAGVLATVAFTAVLVPWGARVLGPAGGAQGAAWAELSTEAVVTIMLATLSRHYWADSKLLRTTAALAGGVAAVALLVRLAPLSDVSAVVASFVVFAATFLAIGGVDRADLAFCRRALTRSRPTLSPVLSPELT